MRAPCLKECGCDFKASAKARMKATAQHGQKEGAQAEPTGAAWVHQETLCGVLMKGLNRSRQQQLRKIWAHAATPPLLWPLAVLQPQALQHSTGHQGGKFCPFQCCRILSAGLQGLQHLLGVAFSPQGRGARQPPGNHAGAAENSGGQRERQQDTRAHLSH